MSGSERRTNPRAIPPGGRPYHLGVKKAIERYGEALRERPYDAAYAAGYATYGDD